MQSPRVAVVGAGLAGLGVAWRLARRGLDVALLERGARPGGRCSVERIDGFCFEPGYPALCGADRELLGWIAEVGLRDELLPLRPLVEARVHRGRMRTIDPRSLAGVARIPGVRPHHALRLLRLPRLLARYGPLLDPDAPERAADLDDRSLADFGRLYFGASVLASWMAPEVAVPALADEAEASRVLFLAWRHRCGDARAGLPRAPLAELPEAAAARLKTHFHAPVSRVEAGTGDPLRLTLGGVGGSARVIDADAVVLAVPAPEAARIAAPLLCSAERDVLGAVAYAAGVTLCVALRRPLAAHPQRICVPSGEGSPLAALLLEPGVSGGRVPAGKGLATLRATPAWAARRADATDPEIERELLEAFERIVPGARAAVLFTHLFRSDGAQPRFDVGRYRDLARFARVQRDRRSLGRRVYFAGDYLVEPSWEGALRSAQRAAEALEADFA